jgi:hypothetical protein
MSVERRIQRSDNPLEATSFFLAAAVRRGRYLAMTLADLDGLIVADAPSDINSEALAAIAPFAVRGPVITDGLLELVTRGEPLRVWNVEVCSEPLYLAAVGGDAKVPADAEAALNRILDA